MSNKPNRQQRRAMERKQEAYATIQKLTPKAVKPKRSIQTRTIVIVGTGLFCALLVVWAFTWTGHFAVPGFHHELPYKSKM